MDETEHQHKHDSLDIKIVNLPGLDDDDVASRATADVEQKPRFLPRERTLQIAFTASIVVLVLLIVLGSSLSVRTLATRLFTVPQPLPTATLVPGIDLFYIEGNPIWGRATLDGNVIKHLPLIGIDPPLQLSRGQHVLNWLATPFQMQHCTISVPPLLGTDTCDFNDSTRTPAGQSAWIISFVVSLNTLSDTQRAALIQASQAALDARQTSEVVWPGEVYNDPSQKQVYAIAKQPLRATLHFRLDIDPASKLVCRINGQATGQGCVMLRQDCRLFCDDPSASTPPNTLQWDVLVPIFPEWDYTTLDGYSMARNQPDESEGAIDDAFLAPLRIVWDGAQWHVTALLGQRDTQAFGSPICGSVVTEMQTDATFRFVRWQAGVTWHFAAETVYAAGCVAIALPRTDGQDAVTPSSRVAAYCLHRFGMLIAANEIAHRLWPNLPVADAYEQNLVQQMVATTGVTWQ